LITGDDVQEVSWRAHIFYRAGRDDRRSMIRREIPARAQKRGAETDEAAAAFFSSLAALGM